MYSSRSPSIQSHQMQLALYRVANAKRLCGKCRTNVWQMQYECLANAVRLCGKCHTTRINRKRSRTSRKLSRLKRIILSLHATAVSSIEYAKLYYTEFKRQNSGLKIVTIFSYRVNDPEDEASGVEDENNEDTNGLSSVDRDFLEKTIKDYNEMFGNKDAAGLVFLKTYKV